MIETTKSGRREVTLPAATLLDVLALARGAGDDKLRSTGQAAGRLLAERLSSAQNGSGNAGALPVDLFWKRVGEVFASRGWGAFEHANAGAGVGELRSSDWIEAERAGAGSCAFGAGMIQGLLEAVAGTHFEVAEVECRAAGASACRFLFGSAAALAGTTASAQRASSAP